VFPGRHLEGIVPLWGLGPGRVPRPVCELGARRASSGLRTVIIKRKPFTLRSPSRSTGSGSRQDPPSGSDNQATVLARSNKQALAAMATASQRARAATGQLHDVHPPSGYDVSPLDSNFAGRESMPAAGHFGEERAVPTAEGLVLDAGVSPEAAPSTQTFDCSPEIARIHRWSGLQDWVGRRDQRVSRENAIRFAIVAVGAAVVALSAVVVALNITGNSSPGTSSSSFSSSSNGATGSPARHSKSTPSTSGVRPSAPRTASQIPPASSTGGPPVLSSLSPSTGQAGQSVVATGMGFFSSNGDIQAYFGGVEAQTSCPSQSTCTFTVPPAPVSQTSVPVTLTTQAGTSNALIFDYG